MRLLSREHRGTLQDIEGTENMIKDVHERNESVKPHDFEFKKLRSALPEYFDKDGNFMFDRFQETLRDNDVNLTKEGYELKFLGKSYAKYLTSTETETVIVPDLKHNAEPENQDSENLYIVGDNLDALKHLLGSYTGKVKCIYIDPPYNTGSDGFVYNDDFGFTPPQLVDKIGISEDEAQRVYDLQGKSSHSAWLTFMYPRLQLAKELLSDDGVIFISIDDNEQSNLKIICDEIFGEQNFIGTFIQDKSNSKSDSENIQKNHEFILCYKSFKSKQESSILNHISIKEKEVLEESGRFFFLNDPITTRAKGGVLSERPNLGFTIYFHPESKDIIPIFDYDKIKARNPMSGLEIYNDDKKLTSNGYIPIRPPSVRGQLGAWTWDAKKVEQEKDQLFPFKSRSGSFSIKKRTFIEPSNINKYGNKIYTLNSSKSVSRSILKFSSNDGSKRIKELFNAPVFDYPKNIHLLSYLIDLACSEGDIFLDFFSGSGSSADAIIQSNSRRNTDIKFIQIQINENISPDKNAYTLGYRTIDEIGRERIKRAAEKIKSETGVDIDYGFRLFRLEEPSGQVLNDLEKFDPDQDDALFSGDYVSKFDNLDQQGTPGHDTILTTWLVQDSYGLTADTRQVELSGYSLDVCGDSAYIIEPGLTSDDVMSLVTMVENGKLDISRVVIFGYSVGFSAMHELKKNLSVLKSGKSVTVIERF